MRACIMYIWKIFDEILKEIVKLEQNVLKNQSLFSPDYRCFASNKLAIDPIDSLILHTGEGNITNYELKKLSLILNTVSMERTNQIRLSLPDLLKTHSPMSEIVLQLVSIGECIFTKIG